ncbi:MAG: N-acetylglutaminylglutamine amidotransferase, partial [Gammaproteobacteria bacterium]|nr:N-acetylglutaminylglutamine amidotransferase [Gammaproteobacteria bacterium]
MCGICGEIRFDDSTPSVDSVARMNRVLFPRGPDGAGIFQARRLAVGHQRLKILDLSEHAAQPMIDNQLGLGIVFNGCIYNFRDLRVQLRALGYQFFSDGDTEVILKAYAAWGIDCVEHFHGMFAFAIWERDSGRLVLARDRFGIKPIYYSELDNGLRFASTLPALLATDGIDTGVDPVALHHYMSFHAVVPAPHTIIKGIRKLPPATVRVIEPDGRSRDHCFWRLHYGARPEEGEYTYQDWQEATLNALRKAVERRLVSDVPVGVLLSGGLDSSLIVGLLAEQSQRGLNTFSVGFESVDEEKGDEFQYSDIIAKHFGTEHHQIRVDSKRLLPALGDCINAMSEPMVSHDVIGFYLLSEQVSKHVKVVQS